MSYDEYIIDPVSGYAGSRRQRFHSPGVVSLAALCLRDGSLDVDVETGIVYSVRNGKRRRRRLRLDRSGYLGFTLNREVRRGGKVEQDGKRRRRRRREYVLAHRLAVMKRLAVDRAEQLGGDWRELVEDIPAGLDVEHKNRVRDDNRRENLELATERANRRREEMTADECDAVADYETAF